MLVEDIAECVLAKGSKPENHVHDDDTSIVPYHPTAVDNLLPT